MCLSPKDQLANQSPTSRGREPCRGRMGREVAVPTFSRYVTFRSPPLLGNTDNHLPYFA